MKGHTFRNFDQEHMARAVGKALPISFKQSFEICRFIRNRSVNEAKKLLNEVLEGRLAIPFKRYNFDLGHKKKIGPGRHPQNTSTEILKLIETAEANAQFKGLNTSNLVIVHLSAHNAGKTWHYGRKSRRRMKRANLEIVVKESAKKIEAKNQKQSERDD